MLRPKHVVFALIFLMMGYVLVHNERFLVEPESPAWAHFSKYGWWILTHGIAGVAAMFLAPFQFSERLRQRYTNVHHVVGYVYVAGILFLAPLGIYVQYISEALDGLPRSFTVLATVDAALLYTTTGIALVFARRRRLTLHRQWMTRSYAVALVFFQGRLILGVTGLERADVTIVQAVIWSCLALSVPVADVINDWSELRRTATVPVKSPPASASARAALAPSA